MSAPISFVIPALDDRELLERSLPALLEEVARRAAGDEVIVVDDTGRGTLAEWLERRAPKDAALRWIASEANSGFARAATAGLEAARHALACTLNPDVLVRPGFAAPLARACEPEDVFAAAPRILLFGDETRVETRAALELHPRGLVLRQPGLETGVRPDPPSSPPRPVPFAVGGACLMKRARFFELGGFDPLFEPFYLEDLDLGWRAWRRGWRVLYEPASTVEHHHRGTIARHARPPLVQAAIERNHHLLQWKHLDHALLPAYLEELGARVVDAWVAGDRDALVWLALALEDLPGALAARAALPPARVDTATLCRVSSSEAPR